MSAHYTNALSPTTGTDTSADTNSNTNTNTNITDSPSANAITGARPNSTHSPSADAVIGASPNDTAPTEDGSDDEPLTRRRSGRLAELQQQQPTPAPTAPPTITAPAAAVVPAPPDVQPDSDDESVEGEPQCGAITDRVLADRLIGTKFWWTATIDGVKYTDTGTIVRTAKYSNSPFLLHVGKLDTHGWESDFTFLELLDAHQKYLCLLSLPAAPLAVAFAPPSIDADVGPNSSSDSNTNASANARFAAPPFAPHPTAQPMPLATPSGYSTYPFQLPIDGLMMPAKVLRRTITQGYFIEWRFEVTKPDRSTFEHTLPHETVMDIVRRAKQRKLIMAPRARTPTCTAFQATGSLSCVPGVLTEHPMVGLPVKAHVPMADGAHPTGRKRKDKKTHVCLVDAVLPRDAGCHDRTIYFLRIKERPQLCLCMTYAQLGEARQKFENDRLSNRKQKSSGRLAAVVAEEMDPDYEFLKAADMRAAIKDLAARFPDDPTELFGLGLVADRRRLPKPVSRLYQRALAPVAQLAAANDPDGWKLLLLFHAIVAPPPPRSSPTKPDRTNWIKRRLVLFLQGRWDVLLANASPTDASPTDASPTDAATDDAATTSPFYPMKKAPKPPAEPDPSPLMDAVDKKAAKAQYALTALSSVRAASAALFAPPDLPPAAPGAVTAALRKLHPQERDSLPPVPPGPAPGGGDCPIRFLARTTALPRFRSPLAPPPSPADSTPMQFSCAEYIRMVRRRDTASAGGCDGITFMTLRTWFDGGEDDTLSQNLTTALNLILANKLPETSRALVCAARCVPLPKNDKGEVRPIAIGSCLFRLVGAMCHARAADDLRAHFLPLQFGVGVRGGAELMLSAIRAHLELNPDHLLIQTDAASAFQAWDRKRLWEEVDCHFPSLSEPLRFRYGSTADVLFAEASSDRVETMKSTVGSGQGCPFGSLTFCLALQPILERLNEEYGDECLIVAYCDDVYILGEPKVAAEAYARWRALYASFMQGSLRDDKGCAFSTSLSEETVRAAGIPASMRFSGNGVTVLGVPVGGQEFVDRAVGELVDELVDGLQTLARAPLAHARHSILQKSLCCKPNYIQRALPTGGLGTTTWDHGQRLDTAYRHHAQGFVRHTHLTDRAWLIATMPPSMGGMGIRTFSNTADAAYLASYSSSRSVLPSLFPRLASAFESPFDSNSAPTSPMAAAAYRANERLTAACEGCTAHLAALAPATVDALISNDISSHGLQKKVTRELDAERHRLHFSSLSVRDRAQTLSHEGDPFTFSALPTSADLTISTDLFSLVTARRLLLPVTTCNCEAKRCPICHKSSNELGDHALVCNEDSNPLRRTAWHDEGYRVLHRLFKMAGWESRTEVTGALLNSDKRPDILVYKGDDGANLFIDWITCAVFAEAPMASVTPGHAADVGVATKNGDWLELVEQQGDRFLGCAAEDGGRLSDELVDVIDKACAVIGGTRGEQQTLVNYWRQRLAVANARGVAKVIKARTPLCTGDHYPLRPHHFSHIQAVPPPLQPRQHLPARAGTCLPCNAPLPTATNGRASPLPPPLNRNAGLAADHESD